MKTSYFAKYKKDDGISIAKFVPFKIDCYDVLFPNCDLVKKYKKDKDERKFFKEYYSYLKTLNQNKVYNDLKDKTLLCYEKSEDFCHRSIVSYWLERELSVCVPEYDYDILEFQNEYRYLSNFWPCNVDMFGAIWSSLENIYQAGKCLNKSDRRMFIDAHPGEAKKLGRKVKIRLDFDDVKDDLMYKIVKAKFTQNKSLGEKLISTGNRKLYEGNYWGDQYWGINLKTMDGANKLGKILMRVRKELKNN